jgi:hypothetical protein
MDTAQRPKAEQSGRSISGDATSSTPAHPISTMSRRSPAGNLRRRSCGKWDADAGQEVAARVAAAGRREMLCLHSTCGTTSLFLAAAPCDTLSKAPVPQLKGGRLKPCSALPPTSL